MVTQVIFIGTVAKNTLPVNREVVTARLLPEATLECRPIRVLVDVSAVPRDPVGAGRYTIELVTALHRTGEVDL